MNTSRDIEKLFDHFGGNAGDYQEIGRENEAKSARTRWPLLATLDLAQPEIPEIAQRRDAEPKHPPLVREPAADIPATTDAAPAPAALTPIARGKAPLFARAHRRTIPPVDNAARLDSLSSSRFAALGDAAPEPADEATAPQAPAFLSRSAPPVPRVTETATQAARAPRPESAREATHSILGKLFNPQTPPPASPPAAAPKQGAESLGDVFTRLRQAGSETRPDSGTGPRRTWGSRS